MPRVRLVVPDDPYDDWEVRLELVDDVDPGRWCTAEDVWDESSLAVEVAGGADHVPRLAEAVTELALTLAGCVESAAELATVHEPAALELDVEAAERFLEQAPAELARRGIELVGPERLVRAGISLRGRATPTAGGDHSKRFGREAVVQWRLVVADDDGPAALSLAELERAAHAGATLLHSGRRWVRIDPAALRRARKRLEDHVRDFAEIDAVTLLRLAGEGELDRLHRAPPRRGPTSCSAGSPTSACARSTSRRRSTASCVRTSAAGLAWLRFLERLGLGGCLADDMGLGKTATTLAHLLERPGPHLVICPLSVVHNWEAEAGRFAPSLRVVVHHGAERDRRRSSPAPTSSSPPTACSHATSSTSPPSSGQRSSPTRRR